MKKIISRGRDFPYSAPTVTGIEVAVEQGFANTDFFDEPDIFNEPDFTWDATEIDIFA